MIFGESHSAASIAEYTNAEEIVGESGHDETRVRSRWQVG